MAAASRPSSASALTRASPYCSRVVLVDTGRVAVVAVDLQAAHGRQGRACVEMNHRADASMA